MPPNLHYLVRVPLTKKRLGNTATETLFYNLQMIKNGKYCFEYTSDVITDLLMTFFGDENKILV